MQTIETSVALGSALRTAYKAQHEAPFDILIQSLGTMVSTYVGSRCVRAAPKSATGVGCAAISFGGSALKASGGAEALRRRAASAAREGRTAERVLFDVLVGVVETAEATGSGRLARATLPRHV